MIGVHMLLPIFSNDLNSTFLGILGMDVDTNTKSSKNTFYIHNFFNFKWYYIGTDHLISLQSFMSVGLFKCAHTM